MFWGGVFLGEGGGCVLVVVLVRCFGGCYFGWVVLGGRERGKRGVEEGRWGVLGRGELFCFLFFGEGREEGGRGVFGGGVVLGGGRVVFLGGCSGVVVFWEGCLFGGVVCLGVVCLGGLFFLGGLFLWWVVFVVVFLWWVVFRGVVFRVLFFGSCFSGAVFRELCFGSCVSGAVFRGLCFGSCFWRAFFGELFWGAVLGGCFCGRGGIFVIDNKNPSHFESNS